MSPQNSPAPQDDPSKGDPWHAFGYLVSGVFLYGLLGWLADRWLNTGFLVVVGILIGAGFGLYMTWARFNKPYAAQKHEPQQGPEVI